MREVTISLSSLCGDPSGRTAFPTFWGWGAGGKVVGLFLIFFIFFFFCTWPTPDSGALPRWFHFRAPMH